MQAVAHNLTAMFTDRQLNISTKEKGKAAEKLNTGFRINKAADDAAGLTISEGMRWQVRGLNKAENNCQDGASFCQVADGAMSELEDILQRMRELSVQAANDTNTPQDRAAIQSEINELVAEVGNITSDTKFNDIDVFGWDRERVQFKQNAAGEWISTGEKVTIKVEGNNYGLTEIVGKDHIWMGRQLNDPIQFTSDNPQKWQTTGQNLYYNPNGRNMTSDEVVNTLKKYIGSADTIQFENTNSATQILNDTAKGYQATIIYDTVNKMTNGTYPVKEIKVDKGKFDAGNNFTFEENETTIYSCISVDDWEAEGRIGYANGKNYGSAWIDFSGLNVDYDVSSLYGQGFNSTCSSCYRHYSINFTDQEYDNQLSNGMSYKSNGDRNSPRLEIGIKNCKTGEDLVKAMMEAVNDCPDFGWHYTQYACNDSEPSKFYIFDTRNGEANGGISTFEPAMRNEKNQLVVKDTVLTDMDNPPSRWVYSTKEMWIQSGSTENSGFFIDKPKVNPALLGIDKVNVMDYDLASSSITTCDFAIDMLNEERTKMGVQQNRLEIAAGVDASTGENTQAAESRIRDADMAEEMVNYSKHNILEQAGQSLLAQANQSMQGVVTILGS